MASAAKPSRYTYTRMCMYACIPTMACEIMHHRHVYLRKITWARKPETQRCTHHLPCKSKMNAWTHQPPESNESPRQWTTGKPLRCMHICRYMCVSYTQVQTYTCIYMYKLMYTQYIHILLDLMTHVSVHPCSHLHALVDLPMPYPPLSALPLLLSL